MDPKAPTGVEEDDEFEEFEQEEWSTSEVRPDSKELWDTTWDDAKADDRVSVQIRAVQQGLQQQQATGQVPPQS